MKLIKAILDKIKRIFISEQKDIVETSFFLMFIIGITKLSGFLYSAIVASKLGANRPLDIFILANTLPEMIGNLILIGIIGAVFIPVLIKVQTKSGHEKFLKLFNTLLNISILCFIILALVISISANWMFPFLLNTLLKSNETFSPSEISEIISMMRILFIPQIVLGVSTFYSSGINIYNRFLIPQLAPLFYNLGRILGAYILIPFLGGAQGLVWGTLIGAFFHLAIQIPLTFRLGIRHMAVLEINDRNTIESIKFGIPRIIGLGAEYFANSIDKFIAARFVGGSVSALDFAIKLISIPLSLFGLTFSTASFPTLSRLFQNEDKHAFKELFLKMLNQILFLAIPMTIILLILRVSLVRLFFGIFGGQFDFDATYLTAWIVSFFAFGLALESARSLLYRSFFAANNTVLPLISAIFTVLLGMITGILFTNYFSHFDTFEFQAFDWNAQYFFETLNGKAAAGGLALSSSVVYTLEFFLLIYMFNKNIVNIQMKELLNSIAKKILSGVIMGLVMYSFFKLWGDTIFQEKTIILFLLVSVTMCIGLSAYLLASYVLKIPEFSLFMKFGGSKISQKIKQQISQIQVSLQDYS